MQRFLGIQCHKTGFKDQNEICKERECEQRTAIRTGPITLRTCRTTRSETATISNTSTSISICIASGAPSLLLFPQLFPPRSSTVQYGLRIALGHHLYRMDSIGFCEGEQSWFPFGQWLTHICHHDRTCWLTHKRMISLMRYSTEANASPLL